jgi:hypothetical protein
MASRYSSKFDTYVKPCSTRKGPSDAYIRIVVLIDVLDVEFFGSEVEHVTLIVHPDVFGVFEGFQDVLARPQERLEIGRLVGLGLR